MNVETPTNRLPPKNSPLMPASFSSEGWRISRDVSVPELRPPAHVQVARSNAGSSTDAVSSSAQVFGPALSPSTVLSHYAPELVAAGWSTTAPAVGDRVAAQFFEAKDPSGAAWEGVLIAEGGGGALTLTLTMHPRPIR